MNPPFEIDSQPRFLGNGMYTVEFTSSSRSTDAPSTENLNDKMSARRSLISLAVAQIVFAVCASGQSITLSTAASPAAAQPGVTVVTVTGTGFPSGTILPASTQVELVPQSGGARVTTAATSVTLVVGSTRRVAFLTPIAISVASPTTYLISLSGTTTTGQQFSSSNRATLVINPAAALLSVAPNQARQGDRVNLTLTGRGTSFVQGSTRVSLGPGVSIAGLAPGTPGVAQVLSPTLATAEITINSDATPGVRTASVQTGTEQVTLVGGFTVNSGIPVLTSVSPSTGQAGQSLVVTVVGRFTNFSAGATTANFGPGITVNSATVASQTSVNFNLSIAPGASPGPRTVAVTTGAENVALANSFSVTTSAAPTITDFNPKSGGIGTLVTVTGSGLSPNPRAILSKKGGGNMDAPITNSSPTSVAFVIPAGAATGPFSVAVGPQSAVASSALNVEASSDFSVSVAPPTLDLIRGQSVTYALSLRGSSNFTQLADITVSGLPPGATSSIKPAQLAPGQISVLTITAPPAQALGSFDLTITAAARIDGSTTSRSAPGRLNVVAQTTSFIGRVVVQDPQQTPLAGVTITMLGKNGNGGNTGCSGTARSDAAGNFALQNLPNSCTGMQLIGFDGLTATAPSGRYAGVNLVFTLTSGQVTASPVLVHLPRIDDAETFQVSQNAAADQTFTFQTIPGLIATVYAGTTLTMPDGSTPNPFPLSANYIPPDRLPDAKPPVSTMINAFFVSFHPTNGRASRPVAVTYPNSLNTRPGTIISLMTLDPTLGKMLPYGTGRVSSDGRLIVPDVNPATPGRRYGISNFDWHGGPPPPPPTPTVAPSPAPKQTEGGPVDLATGVEIFSVTDLRIRGARGSIEASRTYGTFRNFAGPYGNGTSHNYDYRINTASPNTAAQIVVIPPEGTPLPFARQPDNSLTNTNIVSMRGATMRTAAGSATVRWKDGTAFTFDACDLQSCYLTKIEDPNGNQILLVRDANVRSRLNSVSDPVGRQIMYAYDTQGRVNSVTDHSGRTVRYTYNAASMLETVTDPIGGVTRYEYDLQGRFTRSTDKRGIVTFQNTYDSNGRVFEQIAANGGRTKFEYTLVNPLVPLGPVQETRVTDALGRITTYRFNTDGYLVEVTDPLGQRRFFDRQTGTNFLLAVRGLGRCAICGDPAIGDIRYTYDDRGNVLTVTNSLNQATVMTYEPIFNKMAASTNAEGNTVQFGYDAAGNLTSTRDPRGNQTRIEYGQFGLPARSFDALNNATQMSYDALGNRNAVTDALGNVTRFRFDGLSRLVETMDANGRRSKIFYDDLDRRIRSRDGRGAEIRYEYDGVGNLTALTDPRGNTTRFVYDAMSRATRRTDPLNRSESFVFDLKSNLTQKSDRRGRISTFAYDPLDRLVTETYDDATVQWSYDGGGRVQDITDTSAGAFHFDYDAAGRLLANATPFGAISYVRDRIGRTLSRQVAGQPRLDYSYDSSGNLTGAYMPGAGVTLFYDARNLMSGATRTNGVVTAYYYDAIGRSLSIQHTRGNTTVYGETHEYDSAGNLVLRNTTQSTVFRTAATTGTYDVANQILAFGSNTFTHDANGNRLTTVSPGGVTNYTWDARNRLQSVRSPDGTVTETIYDPSGYRLRRQITGSVPFQESAVVDDHANLASVSRGGTSMSILAGRRMDQIWAIIGAAPAFGLESTLDSVVAVTDAGGNVTQNTGYDPYGTASGTGSYPFGFVGRSQPESGLQYMRARYYDAEIARFLSEDPIAYGGGDVNLFRYVSNNPIMSADRTGLKEQLKPIVPSPVPCTPGDDPTATQLEGASLAFKAAESAKEGSENGTLLGWILGRGPFPWSNYIPSYLDYLIEGGKTNAAMAAKISESQNSQYNALMRDPEFAWQHPRPSGGCK
jgi:RHS repeat-associated protein